MLDAPDDAMAQRPNVTRLAPRGESSHLARRAVVDMCTRCGLPEIADDACLVASELVTNAATHAHTSIELVLHPSNDGLRIEVADGSSEPPVVAAGVDGDALGGRGLVVVARLARAWGSEPRGRGKVVWAVLDSAPTV